MISKLSKRAGRRSQTTRTLALCLACAGMVCLVLPALAFAAEPVVEGETFSQVGTHGVTLSAQVNPEDLPGSYHYAYGPASTFSTAPSVTAPVGYEATPFAATVELTGLEPGTEYEFQLIVTNNGEETAKGPVMVFKTLPVTPAGLPDERVFEMVTPVENDNADVFVPYAELVFGINGFPTRLPFEVSPDGGTVTYPGGATVGGVGIAGAGAGNQYLARRAGGGWRQSNIAPEGRRHAEYEGFTEDLSTGVVVSGEESPPRVQPLVPGAPGEGYPVLYACNESMNPCTAPEESSVVPQNPFQALFTGPLNRSPGEFGAQGFSSGKYGVMMNGSPEIRPVFAGSAPVASKGLLFEANDALLHGAGPIEKELVASVASEIANGEDSNYLYDVAGSQLSLVDVLPAAEGGGVVGDATFGGPPFIDGSAEFDPPDFGGVISGDGMRVYWTDLHTGVVYVRVGGVSTTRVSEGTAQYWASAADGRYAFYTEGAIKDQEGLYRFDAQTDTRKQLVARSGSVQGVIGTNENGEEVYFVANGVLAGASSGGVLPQEGQPNLYVKHGEEAPVFIAILTPHDGYVVEPFFRRSGSAFRREVGDWQPGLADRTAEVSAGGGGVVFMSSASLPVVGFPQGYPAGGAENVYVFNAAANELYCVSCSASGEPGADSGFVPISWNDTYTPRWMADEGNRVFFDTSASLVPQDTNGAKDVYEWEREGTGSCKLGEGANGGCVFLLSGGTSKAASWLVGASASGNDVFIVTRAQLAPEDQNGADDLYDARVGGVRPVSPLACMGTGCQGVPAPPPTFATPPSVTFSGVGNFPPPAPTTTKKAASKPKAKTKSKAKSKAKPCKRGHAKRGRRCAPKRESRRH
jgi:hypothetical protein